jgi:hypothetical protein
MQSKNKLLRRSTLNSTILNPMFNLEVSNSTRVVNGSMQSEIQTSAMRPSLISANQNSTEFSDNLLTILSKLYATTVVIPKKPFSTEETLVLKILTLIQTWHATGQAKEMFKALILPYTKA